MLIVVIVQILNVCMGICTITTISIQTMISDGSETMTMTDDNAFISLNRACAATVLCMCVCLFRHRCKKIFSETKMVALAYAF